MPENNFATTYGTENLSAVLAAGQELAGGPLFAFVESAGHVMTAFANMEIDLARQNPRAADSVSVLGYASLQGWLAGQGAGVNVVHAMLETDAKIERLLVPVPHMSADPNDPHPQDWSLLEVNVCDGVPPRIVHHHTAMPGVDSGAVIAKLAGELAPLLGMLPGQDGFPPQLASRPAPLDEDASAAVRANYVLSLGWRLLGLRPEGPPLGADEWLTDEHLRLVMQDMAWEFSQEHPDLAEKVSLVDPAVVHLLKSADPETARNEVARLRASKAQYIFLPYNDRKVEDYAQGASEGSHWTLILLERKEGMLLAWLFDSAGTTGVPRPEELLEELETLGIDMPGQMALTGSLAIDNSLVVPMKGAAPQQQNGYECGDAVLAIIRSQLDKIAQAEQEGQLPDLSDAADVTPDRNALCARFAKTGKRSADEAHPDAPEAKRVAQEVAADVPTTDAGPEAGESPTEKTSLPLLPKGLRRDRNGHPKLKAEDIAELQGHVTRALGVENIEELTGLVTRALDCADIEELKRIVAKVLKDPKENNLRGLVNGMLPQKSTRTGNAPKEFDPVLGVAWTITEILYPTHYTSDENARMRINQQNLGKIMGMTNRKEMEPLYNLLRSYTQIVNGSYLPAYLEDLRPALSRPTPERISNSELMKRLEAQEVELSKLKAMKPYTYKKLTLTDITQIIGITPNGIKHNASRFPCVNEVLNKSADTRGNENNREIAEKLKSQYMRMDEENDNSYIQRIMKEIGEDNPEFPRHSDTQRLNLHIIADILEVEHKNVRFNPAYYGVFEEVNEIEVMVCSAAVNEFVVPVIKSSTITETRADLARKIWIAAESRSEQEKRRTPIKFAHCGRIVRLW